MRFEMRFGSAAWINKGIKKEGDNDENQDEDNNNQILIGPKIGGWDNMNSLKLRLACLLSNAGH